MLKSYKIGDQLLTLSTIRDLIDDDIKVELSDKAIQKVKDCRSYLDKKMRDSDAPIYGVNTGFGSLYSHKIADKDLEQLQANLVLSHACGTGDFAPQQVVKLMLLLKVQSLSYGYSGVQLQTIERLLDMYNRNILPVVYQQGSLGASGDLAPLAHLSLPLIGKGEVEMLSIGNDEYYKRRDSSKMLEDMNWSPITLQSKEGLALLNGTQFMSAFGVCSLLRIQKISYLADLISSISIDAFDASNECFDDLIHRVRPYEGQVKTAENIRDFLAGSKIQEQYKEHIQDPYSFRCIPQVHGSVKDVINHVSDIFTTEINSVTDNPTIFLNEDRVISGGNFHGQPLAMGMDYLAIAISELGSISERRTFQLISGKRGLPQFLVAQPGLNSGMMIPQYTAASIVSQNKQLCTPASIDSIVSSNGQEDHVSMGANSATKLYRVVENTERILAIELLNAAQAIAFREHKSSSIIENVLNMYRESVDFLDKDRLLYEDIEKTIIFLQEFPIDKKIL